MGKGKKHRVREKRKKSSETDSDDRTYKQAKYGRNIVIDPEASDFSTNKAIYPDYDSSDADEEDSVDVSDVIGVANSVLYENSNLDFHTEPGIHNSVFDSPVPLSKNRHKGLRESSPFNITQPKMEAGSTEQKIDWLVKAVGEMKVNQDRNRSALESKIDRLKNEFIVEIDKKVKSQRDEISRELGRESERIDAVLRTVLSIEGRVGSLKQTLEFPAGANGETNDNDNGDHLTRAPVGFRPGNGDDSDRSIMASGVNYQDGEDVISKARYIIVSLGTDVAESVYVVNVTRFHAHYNGKPGLIKVVLRKREEKVAILRNKMKLSGEGIGKNISNNRDGPRPNGTLKLAHINVCGWTEGNHLLREELIRFLNADTITVIETHLSGNNVINCEGYRWFGYNRIEIHRRAPKPSGSVGILIKQSVADAYEVCIVDKVYKGILALKLSHRETESDLVIFACYLPPENFVWGRDGQSFFAHLLSLIYTHGDCDYMFIGADFNARIGCLSDILEGCDSVPQRVSIDKSINQHGHTFTSDNYTSISTKGNSVVDQLCAPQDMFDRFKSFTVLTIKDITDRHDLHELIGVRSRLPDHSALLAEIDLGFCETDYSMHGSSNSENQPRFNLKRIPNDFMDSDMAKRAIVNMITRIERETQSEIDDIYDYLCEVIFKEMLDNIPKSHMSRTTQKRRKHTKPF
ncbi:LOW QUALITY PROTEIN: hypothetical protein MAR_022207 [Mya arenaria]|uniref:Endonuclease/exonuclease/phosphatase domain-containing protein n=1 Tax=Mya arenaria TaxID=6604 RepID=A0ABY7DMS7_MYAAR|nr:LOW QUALITY PROTEIN: hypothetical protein MAR_022207 [Mya arenaria]